jgi:hypothetical protein
MGQPEREKQNGTGRTGNTERDRQKRNERIGQAEQGRQNGTGRTGKTEQDRQQERGNGSGRIGKTKGTGRTGLLVVPF